MLLHFDRRTSVWRWERGERMLRAEAADLVISDDNFSSIVGGIEEGRIAYDNIRKVIFLLISMGAAELLMVLLAVITGLQFRYSLCNYCGLILSPTVFRESHLSLSQGKVIA